MSCHTETLKAFEALASSLLVLMVEWRVPGSFQTSKVAENSASAASFTVQVNHFLCRKVHHTHFVWQGQKGDVLWCHVIAFLSLVQTRPTCFYEATSHRGCVLLLCVSVLLFSFWTFWTILFWYSHWSQMPHFAHAQCHTHPAILHTQTDAGT